jgi:cytochrome P450
MRRRLPPAAFSPSQWDVLGDGLIGSTGELWKRQRRLMSSFFTPRSTEQYYSVFVATA